MRVCVCVYLTDVCAYIARNCISRYHGRKYFDTVTARPASGQREREREREGGGREREGGAGVAGSV